MTLLKTHVARTLCVLLLNVILFFSVSDQIFPSFLQLVKVALAQVSYFDSGSLNTGNVNAEVTNRNFLTAEQSIINKGNNTSNTNFTLYTNPLYGFTIKYPSLWTITNVTPADPLYQSFSDIGNSTFALVTKFSSPSMDGNVTIGIGKINNTDKVNSSAANLIDQFINNTIDNRRRELAAFDLIDIEIGRNLVQNRTFNEITSPLPLAIYNLTYSAKEKGNNGSELIPVRSMEVGSIINNTLYSITFISNFEKYAIYLPAVIEMLSSFEITSPSANSQNMSDIAARNRGIGEINSSSLLSDSQARQGSTGRGTMMTNYSSTASPAYGSALPYMAGSVPSNSAGGMPYSDPSYPIGSTAIPYNYPPVPYNYPPVPYNYPPVPYNYPPVPYNYPPVPYNYPPPFWQPNQYYYPTIVSHNTYNDTSGTFHIVGEVHNTTPATINSVQVVASFYDSLNQLIATKFAYTNPSSISAGQRAIFDLTLPPRTIPADRVYQWTLNLIWQ